MNQEKIAAATAMLLEALGEDCTRPGLQETPQRVARMYTEFFKHQNDCVATHLSKVFAVESQQLVVESDIVFHSLCEHHLLPFYGKVHIGYIPDGSVVGLSKLARTVEHFAGGLQIQERLTNEIAQAIMEHLQPQGVIVYVEAEHMCMTMRGVKKPGSKTTSMVCYGVFEEQNELIQQFLQMIK